MNVFEAHLLAIAEAMVEKILMHMAQKLEEKLGLSLPKGESDAAS